MPWLDVWGRYDTAWYLDLVRHGYRAPADLLHQQSNLAFFPLYGWGRSFAAPWTTLLHRAAFHPTMGPFELAAAILFLALSAALFAEREWALATLVLLSLVPVLLSGTVMSATRLVAVAFPAFVPLARWGRREAVDRALVVTFAFAQALFFLAWSRFYWVG